MDLVCDLVSSPSPCAPATSGQEHTGRERSGKKCSRTEGRLFFSAQRSADLSQDGLQRAGSSPPGCSCESPHHEGRGCSHLACFSVDLLQYTQRFVAPLLCFLD